MECNKMDEYARELTYVKFPSKFVWDKTKYCNMLLLVWENITNLGLLIPHTKDVTCHQDIHTISGVVYPTFKEACYSIGL
ncbi:hypothetical protein ACS0TY_013839 [Phlomoides rotata]